MEKGDFIEFDYTGKTTNGFVFDTTIKDVATSNHIESKSVYKPAIMCLGQGHFMQGLDEALMQKDVGIGKHTFTIPAEKAFGKKDAKKIQTVPLSKFTKEKLQPYPGMQINVDGQIASVKRVSGGRVLVDLNHPLAGLDVVYDVDIKQKVTDVKLKVESYIHNSFGPVKHEIKENTLTIFVKTLPEETIKESLEKDIMARIPEIKTITFTIDKDEENKQ